MDVFEAIHTRRSIRKFTDQPVDGKDLETLLAAAMTAPSAGNAQAWQFIVITDRGKLARIKEINPYAAMAERAPLAVLVCGDLGLEKYAGYWVQDCSAAMQNLLLAATGLGLGAVWTGIHPMADRERGFRELCGLPDNVVPLGLAVIGHPDQPSARKNRYNPAKVHQNTFGG